MGRDHAVPEVTASGGGARDGARLLAALAPAAVVPFLGSLVYFVLAAGESWARWTYVGVKVFTLVWPLIATRWILERRLPRIDWKAASHRRALPLGAAIGVAIIVTVGVLQATPIGEAVFAFAPQIRLKVVQLGILDHYVTFALFLSVAHSGLEEYYWRWFLFGNLRRVTRLTPAVAASSLAFASHHMVIVGQYVSPGWAALMTLAVVAAGAVWCFMYERQGTLTGAWLSHMLADIAILWVGYRMLF